MTEDQDRKVRRELTAGLVVDLRVRREDPGAPGQWDSRDDPVGTPRVWGSRVRVVPRAQWGQRDLAAL